MGAAAVSSITGSRSREPRIGSTLAAGFRSGCFHSRTKCSPTRLQGRPTGASAMPRQQHVPEHLRSELGQRILGEGWFAAAHRHARQRSRRSAECPVLLFFEFSAQLARGRRLLSAAGQPRFTESRASGASCCARSWTARGTEPPASRLPRRADGTLVPVAPVKFPRIPGVSFNGVMTTGDLFDYGGALHSGTLTVRPRSRWALHIRCSFLKPTRTGTI